MAASVNPARIVAWRKIPTSILVRPNRATYMIIGSQRAVVNGASGKFASNSRPQTTIYCGA